MKTLTDIIYKYKNNKFSWGTMDCCIFAGLVFEEFHNKKVLGDIVGSYNSKKGAIDTINRLGKGKVENLPTAFLKLPKKDISQVKTGDMICMEEKGQKMIGICNGVRVYFLQEGGGLTTRPIEDCLYCWSPN